MKTNFYNIFRESERLQGCIAVQYTAIAESENQVRELAEDENISLVGYIIEIERVNVRDELGRSHKPEFRVEF